MYISTRSKDTIEWWSISRDRWREQSCDRGSCVLYRINASSGGTIRFHRWIFKKYFHIDPKLFLAFSSLDMSVTFFVISLFPGLNVAFHVASFSLVITWSSSALYRGCIPWTINNIRSSVTSQTKLLPWRSKMLSLKISAMTIFNAPRWLFS